MVNFHEAAKAGLITEDQAARLTAFYAVQAPGRVHQPRFDVTNVLWYAGAIIAMTAMGLFSNRVFNLMGGGGLFITALAYALIFFLAGNFLWRRDLRIPGGLLIAATVTMAPLAVFSIQDMLGWWGEFGRPDAYGAFNIWVKGSRVFMECAAIAAAAVAVRFYPFGFIVLIAAVALWALSMDLTPWFGRSSDFDWTLRAKVSMYFGLGLIALAWAVDLRQRHADYAFWLHLAAAAAFWSGLTEQHSDNEWARFLCCLINIGLIGLALFLFRRVYAVFGVAGIALYLGYLADEVFEDSLLFPFALSAIGLAFVAAGLWSLRNRARIAEAFESLLPERAARLRPRRFEPG
ncbi:hypothetical protein [Methylovirgula sp. 4M-Z18]|uniref:hypothetical protein n=1 Tax=Methylovirgula sp. 4M-Z18 TaxID=2293567 RepID=UPI000E2E9B77|nr:hypothetical protein [Methylovirgula sp. 4M-Z18]RFB76409.1 hypothetical protein DYH55_21135 [Methylovirgula sp. 4M-Z18]